MFGYRKGKEMTATATIVWAVTEDDVENFIASAWPDKATPEQRSAILKSVRSMLDAEIGEVLYEAVSDFVDEWET